MSACACVRACMCACVPVSMCVCALVFGRAIEASQPNGGPGLKIHAHAYIWACMCALTDQPTGLVANADDQGLARAFVLFALVSCSVPCVTLMI